MGHPLPSTAGTLLHSHTVNKSMELKPAFPHRITQAEHSQYKRTRPRSDSTVHTERKFDQRAAADCFVVTSPFSNLTRMNEKDVLHGLNDRFAGFIDKVRHLEHQNHLLEKEIEDLRQRAHSTSSLEQEYGSELKELRQLVHDITQQKHQIEIEQQHLDDELYNLSKQYEKETSNRSKAEISIVALKKDINDAYQAKLLLEKKAQSLVDELHFSKRNHEVQVSEMTSQIQDAQITVQTNEFGKPELTAALRDIRAQLEGHADLQVAGESFRSQFAKLTESADNQRQALKASQQEIQEYRRHLQAKSIQLDCAKGTREALERQLHDVEDRHNEEIIHYQDTIKQLENELINAKFDISGHLREYQDLLNVKMALDVEILSYRKLLEGEESRLVTISNTHMAMPYIYRQSPVYTLPCVSRQGGQARKLEPHYKFVEEIITETTREIEMSEFEDPRPEETPGGGDEGGWDQRERGSGEAVESPGNQDRAEGDSEQVSDSQQNHVESAPQGEDHCCHIDGERHLGEGAGREDGDKKEPDVVEAGDCSESACTAQRTPNGVQATTEEQHTQDSGDKNMKGEQRDEARGAMQVLKDASLAYLGGEDSVLAGPSESNKIKEKYNAGDSKGVDVGDSTGTAQAKQPGVETSCTESKVLDIQAPSSALTVQYDVWSVAPTAVEEAPIMSSMPEMISSLPKVLTETENSSVKKGYETMSTGHSKEMGESHTEAIAISKSEKMQTSVEDSKSS